jgi:2-dehydropantoate 2-reductase
MRILIVGAGSTGGYFGGRLAQAGRDVTFLVRPARAETLRAHGLQIISPHGNITVRPALVTADTLAGPFDVVLLTVKAFSLDAALTDVTPAIGPDTMILPVLNGMKHMDTLAARFGEETLLGGVCRIAGSLDDQGRVVQLSKLHDLVYGERDGRSSARVERLDAAMRDCGFDAQLSTAIQTDMWEKWVMLASVGGINCLMRGSIGEVEAAVGGAAFAQAFLAECASVATAAGHPPRADFLASVQRLVTGKGSPMTTSMYRDLVAGNPVEAEQILGDLQARAEGFGLATPLIAAAFTNLSVYQHKPKGSQKASAPRAR